MNNVGTIIWAAVVVFVATLATVIALAFAVDDGARVESLAGLVIPAAATLVVGLLALVKVVQLADKVDKVSEQTTDLTNGLGDAKARLAVAQVLAPHLVDPAAEAQLVADRVRVDGQVKGVVDNPHAPV